MKKILLCSLLFSTFTYSQTYISGRIIDANNFHIQLLTAETDKNSFIDTADRIVKILVADAKITVLKFKNPFTVNVINRFFPNFKHIY